MTNMKFEGNGFEYFKIWIVNILLTIITLGIYYPWAKVRMKKYFYLNSTFENKNFDYHATGGQLFLSFIIAAVLVIIFNIVSSISAVISFVLAAVFVIAIPWILWRSMKFDMSVTSFSNIKFNFTGKLKSMYFILPLFVFLYFFAIGAYVYGITELIQMFFSANSNTSSDLSGGVIVSIFTIVFVFTLILIGSYFQAKMNNYYINFLKFASETFNSKLETKAFFTIALKSSAFIIIMTISLIGFFALLSSISVSSLMELKNSSAEELKLLVPYFMIMYFFFILIIFIVNSYYYVKTREYILGNTRLNSIEFSSKMSFRKLTFIMLTNLLFIILTLGFYTPWAKVRVTKYILECTYITSNDLTVYIDTAHEKQSAFGDELADAFDVDLGLAI